MLKSGDIITFKTESIIYWPENNQVGQWIANCNKNVFLVISCEDVITFQVRYITLKLLTHDLKFINHTCRRTNFDKINR